MKRNKILIFNLIFILIFSIIVISNYYVFETKGYVLTPAEYTITKVYSYYAMKVGKNYRIDITYEKDGKEYKSHCFVDQNEFNIIKKHFDNISEDATKSYLGNIKVYKNMNFMILKNQ